MPSGKQILLSELQKLSQHRLSPAELEVASDRFRAALLLHGSTADSAWPTVERVAWLDQDGNQGPTLASNGVFLADLLVALMNDSEIPEAVEEAYPDLTYRDYRAGLHVIWLLITQLYYQPSLASVENGGDLDRSAADDLIENCIAKLQYYRKDPEGAIGCPPEEAEQRI